MIWRISLFSVEICNISFTFVQGYKDKKTRNKERHSTGTN